MSIETRRSDTHAEKFFHFQVVDPLGKVTHATIFARLETPDHWFGSVAFCSVNDTFTRKGGRTHARRLYFSSRLSRQLTQPLTWVEMANVVEAEAIRRLRRNVRIISKEKKTDAIPSTSKES
jgi:hypothetical protein